MSHEEAQIQMVFSHPKNSDSVHFAVESEKHGLYEVRVRRLQSHGGKEQGG